MGSEMCIRDSVRAWADAWLTTTGVSEISVDVETDDAGTITKATVSQSNTGPQVVRPHTFTLAGFNRQRSAMHPTETWKVDFETASADLPQLVGIKRPDLLLPGHGDDDFAKMRLDDTTTAHALHSVTKLPDALDRAVVWSALTNAMRDGSLSVSSFVDAYARSLGRERHAGINAGLRAQALNAVKLWTTDVNGTLSTILGAALDALESAEPGSDTQLNLAEVVLIFVAHSATVVAPGPEVVAARDFASRVLASGPTLEGYGLKVDNALKWKALISLVVLGWADEEDIAAQESCLLYTSPSPRDS